MQFYSAVAILSFILHAAQAREPGSSLRVSHGYEVPFKRNFFVKIITETNSWKNPQRECGGAVIGVGVILTSASCVYGFEESKLIKL